MAYGGIDKHRQNEIKMKENWGKWNFEGNFNALNFDQNQEKIILESGNTDFHELPTEIFLFFSRCLSIFSTLWFSFPKTLWFFSPTPGGGDYRRIYTPGANSIVVYVHTLKLSGVWWPIRLITK
jgi:hypothetical protein